MKPKLGIVCFVRNTYDYKAAAKLFDKTKEHLLERNDLIPIVYNNPIADDAEAVVVANYFNENHIDGLVLLGGTFHLGTLALIMSKLIKDIPILLWAYPELPYDGGKIRLNSLCGVNLDASNLYKSCRKNYKVYIGKEIDEEFIKAVKIDTSLKKAKIGIVGHHAQGFYNLDVDEMGLFQKFGTLINHYELKDILDQNYKDEELLRFEKEIEDHYLINDINSTQFKKTAELCAKLNSFYKENNLNGLAIRCWPEFANYYGIAPCAAMSILQSEDILLSCEGDLDGLISMLVHKTLNNMPPFLADLSQIDFDKNSMLLWHCGVAPYKLHDKISQCTLDTYFSNGRGVTAGFVLKEGNVNLLRLDSVGKEYRLFIGDGKIIPTKKLLCGTYANCEFNHDIKDVFNKVTENGCAHHLSMSYCEEREAILLFATLKNIEIIEL